MASDHHFSAPNFQTAVGAEFGSVGTLMGVDLSTLIVNRSAPFTLTLYWKANPASGVAYTVFSHLLDANGHVIAQNDSPPNKGQRPTTGWIADEYVTDPHSLTFIRQDYTGPATLEVGLYDPATSRRVTLANGADHVALPLSVTVR